MTSGKRHDRITLWSAPLVAIASLWATRSAELTLASVAGFLFSGLMFGPDLDIYSRHFMRWGWLRWLWLPYRRLIPHRSLLSHGIIIGTLLRLVYLFSWLTLAVALIGILAHYGWGYTIDWGWWILQTWDWSMQHRWLILAGFCGLELGSVLHILTDRLDSWLRRRGRLNRIYRDHKLDKLKKTRPQGRSPNFRGKSPHP